MNARIAAVSDVVVGYGSPQIPAFTRSLCKLFDTEGVIIQPAVPGRVPKHHNNDHMSVITVPTAMHPYSYLGNRSYKSRAAELLNSMRPDIIAVFNYNCLEIVNLLEYKPKKVVHYALEDAESYIGANTISAEREQGLKAASARTDIWIFPESNRALIDASRYGLRSDQIGIVYNTADAASRAKQEKSGKIIYAGTIDPQRTIGGLIVDSDVNKFAIDVYGNLSGSEAAVAEMREEFKNLKASPTSNTTWFGQIPRSQLDEILPSYDFALVFWLPISHALLNAAPNKLFQAIAAGVPPITAPHPQARMLVERYGCGLLLEGWERHHLIAGLKTAVELMGTSEYDELVANCERAVEQELSWDVQMNRFIRQFDVSSWLQ